MRPSLFSRPGSSPAALLLVSALLPVSASLPVSAFWLLAMAEGQSSCGFPLLMLPLDEVSIDHVPIPNFITEVISKFFFFYSFITVTGRGEVRSCVETCQWVYWEQSYLLAVSHTSVGGARSTLWHQHWSKAADEGVALTLLRHPQSLQDSKLVLEGISPRRVLMSLAICHCHSCMYLAISLLNCSIAISKSYYWWFS